MLSRHPDESSAIASRQRWLGILARADAAALADLWQAHGTADPPTTLRPAEIGLVMVRGRAGGTGQRFNLGEMTVTRCAVAGPGGTVGHGYVRGRDKQHAELCARFDALLQDPTRRADLLRAVIEPLAAAQAAARAKVAAKAAATKVEFFTLVRGD